MLFRFRVESSVESLLASCVRVEVRANRSPSPLRPSAESVDDERGCFENGTPGRRKGRVALSGLGILSAALGADWDSICSRSLVGLIGIDSDPVCGDESVPGPGAVDGRPDFLGNLGLFVRDIPRSRLALGMRIGDVGEGGRGMLAARGEDTLGCEGCRRGRLASWLTRRRARSSTCMHLAQNSSKWSPVPEWMCVRGA